MPRVIELQAPLDDKSSPLDNVKAVEHKQQGVDEPSEAEVHRIIRKVDSRLIVIYGFMVAISLLDRANLSNANIAGMSKDLELRKGSRYSLVVLIFFAPYVIAEIPCAALVRRLGPRWTLPAITTAWGILILGFGFVHHWSVLIGLRFLLGVLEAGLFPGLIYVLSLWYTRYEIHKRYSLFYFIGLVGSALGGILAYAFMQMAGLGGLAPWRWIFIMEGLMTVVVGLAAFVFLVDYPQNAHKAWRFLTKRESEIILQRIEKDRSDTETDLQFRWAKFFRPALDLRIWGYGFLYTFSTTTGYAVAYFLPIILNQKLGYGVGVSQILTTPPYVFAGLFMYVEGWLCDRWHVRSPVLLYNAVQTIVGLCLLAWTKPAGSQYFGIFLVTSGCNANIPATLAWQANNIRGHWTRTFCSAVLVAMGGVGGIIGALIFRSQDAPLYLPGIYASIVSNVLLILVTASMAIYFQLANQKVRAGTKVIGDLSGFMYTL